MLENFGIGIALFFYFTYEHGVKDMAIFHICNNRTSLQLASITTLYWKSGSYGRIPAEKGKTLTKILGVKSKIAKLG